MNNRLGSAKATGLSLLFIPLRYLMLPTLTFTLYNFSLFSFLFFTLKIEWAVHS